MVKKLSLGYENIHAYENDCIYSTVMIKIWKIFKYCEFHGYKVATNAESDTIPRKILRYFKITHRLWCLYMSTPTAYEVSLEQNSDRMSP